MEVVKNDSPLISVILPTYNRARMLEKAVRSIINQKYENWELIIVDNCSVDDTDAVIAKFNDGRIKLLKIQNNGSIGKSRNLGIRNALGEWIAFIDSDDWWFPNKLNDCVEECNDRVDLIYHDLLVSVNGKVKRWKKAKGWILTPPVINDLMVRGNAIPNSSVMVRRSVIERAGYINEDMTINPSVDYNTWLKVANVTDKFKYVPKALGGYLVHAGGVSQQDMSISYKRAMSDFTGRLSVDDLNHVQRAINFIHGRYLYLKKDYIQAEQPLRKSVHYKRIGRALKAIFMLIMVKFRKLI
jgi:glycosyltransferase involved in cell wall biosynthesis